MNVFAQGIATGFENAKDLNNVDSEYQHFLLSAAGCDPLNSPHASQFAGGRKMGQKSVRALVAQDTHYKHRMHQIDDTGHIWLGATRGEISDLPMFYFQNSFRAIGQIYFRYSKIKGDAFENP